jgi:hypothetical protein
MAHSLTIADWEGYGNKFPIPSADQCVETYCQLGGCTTEQLFTDPNDYDNGLDIATTLQTWQQGGLFGAKPGLFAPVDYTNLDDVRNGLYLSGGLVIGIQVQAAQEAQFPHEWRWVPGSEVLGGHCITLTGYTTAQKLWWGVTWGALIAMNDDFLVNAMDECFALISAQTIEAGKGPSGLNIAQLSADLQQLGG